MTTGRDGVVLSAADRVYWRCAYQFLRSAERIGLHHRFQFILYDLGLGEKRPPLEQRFSWCEFRTFPFASYPPHVALARGTYAWKPILVADVLSEGSEVVLWFDSATIFKRDLSEVLAEIRRRGVHALKGPDMVVESCNPLTVQALQAPDDFLYRRTRPAGFVGLDGSQERARRLAARWKQHALIEAHIAPGEPPYRWHRHRWHRYDQSLLTLLLHEMADAGEIELSEDEIDIASRRPAAWISTRNKLPPWLPRWADPLARARWASYKALDRRYLDGVAFYNRHCRGLRRIINEHFTVFLRRGDGPAAAISVPATSYYADPMLWRQDGRLWLLVEELRYGEGSGRLCALPLDKDLRPGAPVPVLQGYRHVSYPFLTRIGDAVCLLPETSSDRSVDLYVCERFPDRWRLRRRILHNIDAADSTLLQHDGLWWLFTFVRAEQGRENRFLAIYFTDEPFAGEWREHPVNAERRYAQHRFNSLRNAGPFIVEEGRLLRPVQINPDYYGQSLGLMRVDRLTPREFSESRFDGEHWATAPQFANAHHISRVGDVTAWDTRDRIGILDRWRRARRRRSAVEPDAV